MTGSVSGRIHHSCSALVCLLMAALIASGCGEDDGLSDTLDDADPRIQYGLEVLGPIPYPLMGPRMRRTGEG